MGGIGDGMGRIGGVEHGVGLGDSHLWWYWGGRSGGRDVDPSIIHPLNYVQSAQNLIEWGVYFCAV